MNTPLIIPTLILLLTACSPTPTTNPNSPITIPVTTLPQEVIPTTDIQPTPTVISVNASGSLWLQVLSPPDEAVVTTSQMDVIGLAPVAAVITINDDILIVGADGQFKTTVFLEEGPNLIEIIASDVNGNETSLLLTVTYEP